MERTKMVIEIELRSTPLSGWLYDCEGVAHHFWGWMHFASLLQAAIETNNEAFVRR
jgi:hypothetical protein